MKADKNTIIGFVLLGILFFVYFWYTNKQQAALQAAEQRAKDSIAAVNAAKVKPIDPAVARLDSLRRDSLNRLSQAGNFDSAATGTEQTMVVENNLLRVTFSNKGGEIKSVLLKNFKSIDSTPVVLSGGKTDALGYTINTGSNKSTETSNLFFSPGTVVKNADGSQTITYTLNAASGQSITHQYTIKPDNYMIDWNIAMNGANELLTGNALNLHWNISINQQQYSGSYEKEQSRLCFYEVGDGFDYERAMSDVNQKFDIPIEWMSFKQQFFNTAIIAKDQFKSGEARMNTQPDSSRTLYMANASLQLKVPAATTVNVPLQLYYGPNDFYTLKSYDEHLEEIVDLGSGIYSFVKYINRWLIMPVFNFLAGFIHNFGWVIALLTLFIRLITSPLTYTSYLSGAKMKVLRPELAELKKKHGADQQAYAMDQMKIFREAGVNPLGGCIPALLQIPIFFALYSYFSSSILLRGQSFLWAHDLSTYDVIAKLPFSIPFNYGDHVSLFTLTAVITNFIIAFYNMSMTPDQSNPAMKYMPYIFPFVLLFVFNRLPAALTWYYTVSNLITLGIQFVIQNYIINHDKILAEIQEKRKAPKKQSKWQERFAQTVEAQKKLQEMRDKQNKK
ncbi:membrane protein insertase YidC [Ilyomonas limi]|uniref:Membrane protein insertase YidC n=1 Tax=Ilyomonas limi TaxID=2575867 RepID=A0A4U3LDC3_9BACT|nr:membrane protein insertase YidC [Ilyomonas limi]TKK71917.1 membrane protein insertase YidC [Ilyomonas limi]